MNKWRKVLITLISALGIVLVVAFIYPMEHGRCKVDVVTILLRSVALASKKYKTEFGEWPTSLSNLTNNSKRIAFIEWNSEGPVDPWGNYLIYMPFNSEAGCGLVVSWGADGKLGGTGINRDRILKFE